MSPALTASQHNVRQDWQDQVHNQNKPKRWECYERIDNGQQQKNEFPLTEFQNFL